MAKNVMQEIGETMEKIFYKKKDTKKPVPAVPSVEPTPDVEQEEPMSPWRRATDLDAKMKKRMKDAGI